MDWVPAVGVAVALVASVAGWVRQASSEKRSRDIAAALIDEKVKNLKDGDKELALELKEAAQHLQQVATQIQVLNAEQAVINRLNTTTLQALVSKVEVHDRLLAEHGTSIGMIREIFKTGH